LSLTRPASTSLNGRAPDSSTEPASAADTILAALAYSDLFDYPLSLDELHKYQVGTRFSRRELEECLRGSAIRPQIASEAGYYCLRGREEVFAMRAERQAASRKVWRRAALYSRWMARLPFVRMVAVTGALAVSNISTRPDIDLLIVAQPGRVWICRRLLIVLVRLARAAGDDVCPNYVIAQTNLDIDQRDFFTAHELAQMVPMSGRRVYRDMLRANLWALTYLPCGFASVPGRPSSARVGSLREGVERLMETGVFDAWERWEMRRLRSKLRRQVGPAAEVICSPVQCKGHTSLHRRSVTVRFAESLRALGLHDRFAHLLDGEGTDAEV